MAWDDFGKSWIGIIANPAGYLLGRKSNRNAAFEYYTANPPAIMINGNESELAYSTQRLQWINSCASQLKSDDVGKSLDNANNACASFWDNDPYTLQVWQSIQQYETQKLQYIEQTTAKRNTIIFIIVVIFAAILTFMLLRKTK